MKFKGYLRLLYGPTLNCVSCFFFPFNRVFFFLLCMYVNKRVYYFVDRDDSAHFTFHISRSKDFPSEHSSVYLLFDAMWKETKEKKNRKITNIHLQNIPCELLWIMSWRISNTVFHKFLCIRGVVWQVFSLKMWKHKKKWMKIYFAVFTHFGLRDYCYR